MSEPIPVVAVNVSQSQLGDDQDIQARLANLQQEGPAPWWQLAEGAEDEKEAKCDAIFFRIVYNTNTYYTA